MILTPRAKAVAIRALRYYQQDEMRAARGFTDDIERMDRTRAVVRLEDLQELKREYEKAMENAAEAQAAIDQIDAIETSD